MSGAETQPDSSQAAGGQETQQPHQGAGIQQETQQPHQGADTEPRPGRQRRTRSQEDGRRPDRGRYRDTTHDERLHDGGRDRGYDRHYDRHYDRYYDRHYDRSHDRGYDRGYRDQYGRAEPRYRDSGYFDDHYYDESDYHRPLGYDGRSRGSRWRTVFFNGNL